MEELLNSNFQKVNSALLKRIKSQKLNQIGKKIKKLENSLKSLPNEAELLKEAEELSNKANIILANLHQIKPYDKELKCYDFTGKEITIKLPKNVVKNRISEHFFNLAKRAKSKAKNVAIEEQNLTSRLNFYQNIQSAIIDSNSPYDIELLMPKQARSKAKKEKQKVGETFWIEGYKVSVGKREYRTFKTSKIKRYMDACSRYPRFSLNNPHR